MPNTVVQRDTLLEKCSNCNFNLLMSCDVIVCVLPRGHSETLSIMCHAFLVLYLQSTIGINVHLRFRSVQISLQLLPFEYTCFMSSFDMTFFIVKSRKSLQIFKSLSHSCLGYHSVELFQHSYVACENTQSSNLIDFLPFQNKSDMSASQRHFYVPLEEVTQQWCQWFVIVCADAAISDATQDWWPLEGAGPTGKYQILTPNVHQKWSIFR